MSEEPATNDSKKKPKIFQISQVAAIVVVVLLVVAWPIRKYAFDRPPKASTPAFIEIDPICQYVQTLQLNCVVAPAAESVLGPGHFVAYSTSVAPRPKVPFPNGDLFSDACAVPGAKAAQMRADVAAALKSQEQKNVLPFDDITFKLDRAFQAGANLTSAQIS
jgi:hypothetical protein